MTNSQKKREVYRFEADWMVSSIGWSNQQSGSFLLAISSFIEEYNNRIDIVKLSKDHYNQEISKVGSFQHPYPPTKILWTPQVIKDTKELPELIATTADYLRIWRVIDKNNYDTDENLIGDSSSSSLIKSQDQYDVKLESLLNPNQGEQCSPLTSFDWNEIDPSIIVTSSVDACCSIWDIEVKKVSNQTQLSSSLSSSTNTTQNSSSSSPYSSTDINLRSNLRNQIVAHNHEVYDVSFSRSGSGRDVFVSAGGDGSVRMFDLRRLSTSTMLFEYDRHVPANRKALVRVACNKQDPNFITVISAQSSDIIILDARRPGIPVETLKNHLAEVNSMSWAPHRSDYFCSGSNDKQALIWDLEKLPDAINEPLLAYRANGKINCVNWSTAHPDWIAIGYDNSLELLRV